MTSAHLGCSNNIEGGGMPLGIRYVQDNPIKRYKLVSLLFTIPVSVEWHAHTLEQIILVVWFASPSLMPYLPIYHLQRIPIQPV